MNWFIFSLWLGGLAALVDFYLLLKAWKRLAFRYFIYCLRRPVGGGAFVSAHHQRWLAIAARQMPRRFWYYIEFARFGARKAGVRL